MEFKDIKEGTELFSLIYWSNPFLNTSREMKRVIIKKNSGNYLKLKNGIGWTISKKEFNNKWFLTKKEAYSHALEKHQIEFVEIKANYSTFKREMKYLTKKINEADKNGK